MRLFQVEVVVIHCFNIIFPNYPAWLKEPVLPQFEELANEFGLNEAKFLQIASFLSPHGLLHEQKKWFRHFSWRVKSFGVFRDMQQQLWMSPYAKNLIKSQLICAQKIPNQGERPFFALTKKGFQKTKEQQWKN